MVGICCLTISWNGTLTFWTAAHISVVSKVHPSTMPSGKVAATAAKRSGCRPCSQMQLFATAV